MEVVTVFLAVVLLVLVWVGATYNSLVRLRNHAREAWSGIDTELTRRYELIPNLVATVRGYAEYERDLLERVTRARGIAQANHGTPMSQAADERELVAGVRQLLALAESYPELKANTHFLELQRELSNTEDRLQRARRFFNANVRDLNTRVETFPSAIIASFFRFTQWEYFEVEEAGQREPPRAEL